MKYLEWDKERVQQILSIGFGVSTSLTALSCTSSTPVPCRICPLSSTNLCNSAERKLSNPKLNKILTEHFPEVLV